MNTFKDREKGFEKKFANDQEAEFKISAKRNKLLGGWAADILKYDEQKKKNYIVEIIKADFQEAEFKISAKRNKLLGGWVADILKYDEEKKKNYIVEIIKADFQEAGDEDVFRKIKKDLENNNIQDADIRKKMSEFLEAARQQI